MRIEQERVLSGRPQHRVIAQQRPVPAGHGTVLLIHPLTHFDAVRNALAVGDYQRRAVVRLRFAECLQRLLRVGTHRDLGDVDVAVGDRLESEILQRHRLTGSGELGHRAQWGRLRHLTAGVGVDLGVEHQHVDVAPAGQDVVEPTGPDVVRPAVTADDPHAAPDQVVHHTAQIAGHGGIEAVEAALEFGQPLPLSV